jgi:hypothetical protein
MGQVDPQIIDEIFAALDRQVEVRGGTPIGLVICGGTALAALGLVMRTTKDVDVLGRVVETEDGLVIQKLEEFPGWLTEAADRVGRDFDLPEDWLNLGPASQVESGLPEGFEGRLVMRRYGKYLTIYFISRIDQIHFKLYAAVDRGDYHVEDLKALNPTDKELERAVKWVITQDVSDVFKLLLKDFLEVQGYGAISQRI